MNNELNQNTRTLLVSFVFALMVMVPLRFVEVGNMMGSQAVLGESIEAPAPRIESPFDSTELSPGCLTSGYVDKVIAFLNVEKKVKNISKANLAKVQDEIVNFESQRCK